MFNNLNFFKMKSFWQNFNASLIKILLNFLSWLLNFHSKFFYEIFQEWSNPKSNSKGAGVAHVSANVLMKPSLGSLP